jgi:hypothetical protein
MLYLTEWMATDPSMRAALANAGAAGWEVVMRKKTKNGERLLFQRRWAQPVESERAHSRLVSTT